MADHIDVIRETDEQGHVVETVHQVPDEYRTVRRVVYYLLDIVTLIIAARFLLKVFAANPASSFTNFMYGLSEPFIAPFRGMFPAVSFVDGGVFDWASLVAIIVYAVIAYLLLRLFRLLTNP